MLAYLGVMPPAALSGDCQCTCKVMSASERLHGLGYVIAGVFLVAVWHRVSGLHVISAMLTLVIDKPQG